MWDENEIRMLTPEFFQSIVQCDCLSDGFVSHRIAAFDAHTADRSAFEKDDGIVTGQFEIQSGVKDVKKIVRITRPICGTVHCAAIAEENATWEQSGLHIFEISLNVKDGPLGRDHSRSFFRSWESTTEYKGACLGDDHDSITNLTAEQVSRRCFSSAGSSCENDSAATSGLFFHGSHHHNANRFIRPSLI